MSENVVAISGDIQTMKPPRTVDDVVKELNAPIPRDVISSREGGGGKKLAYLEGWYVIAHMNEVLGNLNWSYSTDAPTMVVNTTDEKGKHIVAYTARVTVKVGGAIYTDVGYGDGKDNHPGKAHESAIKEAVTDGLKRACKNLGMSMGLALYDKGQEYVTDVETEPKTGAKNTSGTKANKSTSVPATAGATTAATPGSGGPQSTPTDTTLSSKAKTRQELNDLIGAASRVTIAKRKMTLEELKAYLTTTYGTTSKEALTDDQAKAFADYLNTLNNS